MGRLFAETGSDLSPARRTACGTQRSEPESGSIPLASRPVVTKNGSVAVNAKMLSAQRNQCFQGRFGSMADLPALRALGPGGRREGGNKVLEFGQYGSEYRRKLTSADGNERTNATIPRTRLQEARSGPTLSRGCRLLGQSCFSTRSVRARGSA